MLWIENGRNPGDPARTLGGHWIAVTGYTTNDLLVADPWTNNDDNAEVMPLDHIASVTLDVDNNGGTVANYTQDYLEVTVNDGLAFAGADNMIIFAAVSESPAPEPATSALMAVGFVGLGAAGRIAARRDARRAPSSQKLVAQQPDGCVQIVGVRQPFHKMGGGVPQARLLYAVEGLHQAEPFLRCRLTIFAGALALTSVPRPSRLA